MDLKSRIADDMKSAMRAKESARLETIRMLRAAIQRKEVDERVELDDAGVTQVVQKLVKQGRDAIAQFEDGGRADLADKERASIEVLESYLPAALDDAELESMIDDAVAKTGAGSMRDMGKVMAELKPRIAGRADMGAVSGRIKQRLGG